MKNTAKYTIMIRQVFSGADWSDLERLFSTDRKELMKEIKEYFLKSFPDDGNKRLKEFNEIINTNLIEKPETYNMDISDIEEDIHIIER